MTFNNTIALYSFGLVLLLGYIVIRMAFGLIIKGKNGDGGPSAPGFSQLMC